MKQNYVCILILFLLISGCATRSQQVLPFDLITDGVAFPTVKKDFSKMSPLIVITELADIKQLDFAEAIMPYLSEVDFNQALVLLVLRGQMQDSGIVKVVIRDGNNVIVRTQDIDPGPGNYVVSGLTPPYQTISVNMLGAWGNYFNFLLEREGSGLTSQQIEYVL